jgi:hypothetical protein
MNARYNGCVYQPPEIILELFAEYRRAAGLPMLSRADLLHLFAQTDAPEEPRAPDPARVIRFPVERRAQSPKTTG